MNGYHRECPCVRCSELRTWEDRQEKTRPPLPDDQVDAARKLERCITALNAALVDAAARNVAPIGLHLVSYAFPLRNGCRAPQLEHRGILFVGDAP